MMSEKVAPLENNGSVRTGKRRDEESPATQRQLTIALIACHRTKCPIILKAEIKSDGVVELSLQLQHFIWYNSHPTEIFCSGRAL